MSNPSPADPLKSDSRGNNEFKSGLVDVRDKTVRIANSIYSVHNIASMTVTDFSRTKPLPKSVIFCAVAGFVLLMVPFDTAKVLAFLLLMTAIILGAIYLQNQNEARYVLSIRMNAGNTAGILSDSKEFLLQIADAVFRVIERDAPRHVTFNLDKRVAINHVSDSAISVGAAEGDVINHAKRSPSYA